MAGNRARCGRGIGFSDGLTADPFGLVHHFACVRQAAHVPHAHQQVSACLEDVNGLVVGDDDKALAVHLQDLVANLKQMWQSTASSEHSKGRVLEALASLKAKSYYEVQLLSINTDMLNGFLCKLHFVRSIGLQKFFFSQIHIFK